VSTWTFYADGCQSGYVWSEHTISVAHKPQRQPVKDGWYEHAQNAAEYLQLNFSPRRPTPKPIEPPRGPNVSGPQGWMG
jgi:hypothetical protein